MNISNNKMMPSIKSIQQVKPSVQGQNRKSQSSGVNFNDVFKTTIQETAEVKFSKHANLRLDKRDINLSTNQIERLNQGVKDARQKGINESLMLMDNVALVVNVKNNVVVTALDGQETKNHVFTNIDGAVVL